MAQVSPVGQIHIRAENDSGEVKVNGNLTDLERDTYYKPLNMPSAFGLLESEVLINIFFLGFCNFI